MGLVELDVNVVDSVFLRQESHCVEVLVQFLVEDVLFRSRRGLHKALQRPYRSVQVDVERSRTIDLFATVDAYIVFDYNYCYVDIMQCNRTILYLAG